MLFSDGDSTRCEAANDFVVDTPIQLNDAQFYNERDECPTLANTCPDFVGFDSPDNYMSLYKNACMDTFTPGQIERMQLGWELYRAQGGGGPCCAIDTGIGGGGKSAKSGGKTGNSKSGKNGKNGKKKMGRKMGDSRRGVRGLANTRGLVGSKKKNGFSTRVNTQNSPDSVPDCAGVEAYDHVAWFEIEGIGEEVTVEVDSDQLFTSISAFEGSCDSLFCVDATNSSSGSTGDSQLTFFGEDGKTYYIATTTKGQPGNIGVTICADDKCNFGTGKSGGKVGKSGETSACPLPLFGPGPSDPFDTGLAPTGTPTYTPAPTSSPTSAPTGAPTYTPAPTT